MKTKYFNNLMVKSLVCCGIVAAVTSCRFEDEDYFDQPAALRIEETAKAIQETLVSAPNGWVMQYFVAGTSDNTFEGFNIFAKFENSQKVTLASDHRFLRDGYAGKYTEYSSLYEILKEDGPVLAFNTWNDILTPFVDPVDPSAAPKNLVKDGEGMGGDHNLVVLSYGSDEVMLRGERHSARVRLIPSPGSWQEYMDDVNALKSYITNTSISSYYVVTETDTLYFKNLRSGVITYCERINDPLFPTTLNCVFTPNGFRLHRQNDIAGVPFQEFKMAADSTCLVSENDSVRVIACWDNYVYDLLNTSSTSWNINPSDFSGEQATIYNQLVEEVGKFYKNVGKLEGVGFGTSGSGIFGLTITFSYTNKGNTRVIKAAIPMTIEKVAMGEFEIGYLPDAEGDSNFKVLAAQGSPEAESLTKSLAATLAGRYVVTPGNYFLPKGGTFTLTDGSKSYQLNQ